MISYANHDGSRTTHPFPFFGDISEDRIAFDNLTPAQYLSLRPDPIPVRNDAHSLINDVRVLKRRERRTVVQKPKIYRRRGFAVQITKDGTQFLASSKTGVTITWASCNKGQAERFRDDLIASGLQAALVRVRFSDPEVL